MTGEEATKPPLRHSDPRPLRVGVLCNGSGLTAWQAECLSKVEQLGFAEIAVFVCNSGPDSQRPSIWSRARLRLTSGLLFWRAYERMAVDRRSAASKPVPIPASLANVPKVEVHPIQSGKFRQVFDPDALEAVGKHDLDVLLRFGFGILTGEILDVPRFGIWSFHHGDPAHFRGAPPAFWEIHNDAPVTGVILQRLTEKLDGGVILHAGWFKTNSASYTKTLDRILFGAAHFVARTLTELRHNPAEVMNRTSLKSSGPIYRYPRTRAMLTFFVRTAAAKIRNQYRALFLHQQWSVGILDKPPAAIFESLSGASRAVEGVKWLPEYPGRFLADPFLVEISGETAIIAEEFDWTTGLGHISTLPWTTANKKVPRSAIRSDCHLSYPYTFDYEQATYCTPECAERGGVVLYRLNQDGSWLEHKQLIKGFPSVDPTIFWYEGRWWLFCTSAETGPNEFLYAWFADQPMGEWSPHQLNPLKVDIRAARPAGRPFISQGMLIRPAQDCSEVYGGAVTFNRVLKLTPEEFLEQPAGQLLPDVDRYPVGLHTISGCGEQTTVDGARLEFNPNEFWRYLSNKIRMARR